MRAGWWCRFRRVIGASVVQCTRLGAIRAGLNESGTPKSSTVAKLLIRSFLAGFAERLVPDAWTAS